MRMPIKKYAHNGYQFSKAIDGIGNEKKFVKRPPLTTTARQREIDGFHHRRCQVGKKLHYNCEIPKIVVSFR
jgi:hypothetical protein